MKKKTLLISPTSANSRPSREKSFLNITGSPTSAGVLTEREKALIALAVAATQNCPYCIDAYTNKCMSIGVTKEEMMEAVHVGAAMMAGVTLAHSTQMRKIINKKEL